MTTQPLSARLSQRLSLLVLPVRRRAALAQLYRLDERLLRDIGLSRVDVEAMRRMW